MDRFLNIGHCPGPGLYSVGQDLRVFEQKIVSNRSIFDASISQERLKLPEMQAVVCLHRFQRSALFLFSPGTRR
ncbi:hypothetical protein quinque_008045 [Culex quinquefasciatus]